MSVPSVATSISPHPTSASSIFSSHSYFTEPTMVTPTEGLVSQQILSIPSSSTIEDMATLTSLNVHSCISTNLDCRNAESLPSQESSSFPVDPEPSISDLTTSKVTKIGANIAENQENFKSSSLVNLFQNDSNSNSVYHIKNQHTSTSSTSEINSTEYSPLGMHGKAVAFQLSIPKNALPKSHIQMSETTNDSLDGYHAEVDCLSDNTSFIGNRSTGETSGRDLARHSRIIFENELQDLSSLKPSPSIHSAMEDQAEDSLTVQCHRENSDESHIFQTPAYSCSRCESDSLLSSNEALKLCNLEGKFNCTVLNQKSFHEPSYTVECSRSHFHISSESERNASLCITSFSDLPFHVENLPSERIIESCTGYNYSGANVLPLPCNLVGKHLNVLKSAFILSPQSHIFSHEFSTFFSPKMMIKSDPTSSNFAFTSLNYNYLCYDFRKRWFEEQLVLVLAEVPTSSDHTITLHLSDILAKISLESFGVGSKAVFVKNSVDISAGHQNKDGILNFIKVVPAGSYFESAGMSSTVSSTIEHDHVFVRTIPASDIIVKFNSSYTRKILPLYGIELTEEDSLSGCISCTVIQSNEHFPNGEENLSMTNKGGEKHFYLGLLVPSTKLLNTLNISICQKDSLSIRLGSSRPNKQYSTLTSVDMQLNGNNVEFIPIIPLGMYSRRKSSDPDLRFLTQFAENSFRDVHNIENIFLIYNDSRGEVFNPGMTSQKHLRLADIPLAESSKYDPAAEDGLSKREMEEHHFIDTVSPSNIQSNIPLECLGKRPEGEDENSNGYFHTNVVSHENEIMMERVMKNKATPIRKALTNVHIPKNLDCESIPLQDEEVSNMLSFNSIQEGVKGNFTTIEPSIPIHVKHCPDERNNQQDAFTSNAKLMSEKLETSGTGIGALCRLKCTNISSVNDSPASSQISWGSMYYGGLQKNKDQLGLEISDTNYYSLRRKIQVKQCEGYFKPFKINKSKPSIENRKTRDTQIEEKNVKMREELNTQFNSNSVKSAASSWKQGQYENNCLSGVKNILVTGAQLRPHEKSVNGSSRETEGNDKSTIHKMKCRTDHMFEVPKMSKHDGFSSKGRVRQPSSFKSPDRNFGRNFLLSTTVSSKRSKLTIIIFCLAITSLLISLHALSTDSSLYIKPTFFLVQEDDTTSSFNSESSYLRKTSLPQSDIGEIGASTLINDPVYQSILVKEEMGFGTGEKGTTDSVARIKNQKDLSNSTKSSMDENLGRESKDDVLGQRETSRYEFKTPNGRNNLDIKQSGSVTRTDISNSAMKSKSELKTSISKSTLNFLNSANFTNSKVQTNSAVTGNTENLQNSDMHSEDFMQHNGMTEDYVAQDVKNNIDVGAKNNGSAGEGSSSLGAGTDDHLTFGVKDEKGLSSTENLTKLTLSDEGNGSIHEFDLNIAFIEKNELNAAYGIDSGTTGAEGNFEDDYLGEENMVQMATSGNRVKFPKATRRLPQALIIGVRKGGTRALLEMLHLHPLVQKAAGEAHFFDRDENYAKGLQWYRRRMPPSLKGQITVEKSPSYFVTPEVPERVRAMNASIRLLLIVREPVTRAISDFAQLRSHSLAAKANATIRTKLEGGTDEDYGKKVTRPLSSFESLAILPDGRVDMSWRPISVSLYHRHISAWLEAFPRDQILIVDGDQLASNPAPVLASVEKFLKLRPALTPTHFYFNATKGFYCLRSLPPGQQVDGMAMMPSSLSHSASLPEGKCLRESKGRRHPHVDPSVVHKLRRFFAEHNRRFYEMVGEDFGWPEE